MVVAFDTPACVPDGFEIRTDHEARSMTNSGTYSADFQAPKSPDGLGTQHLRIDIDLLGCHMSLSNKL